MYAWITSTAALVVSILVVIYNILTKRPYVFVSSAVIKNQTAIKLELSFQLQNAGDTVAKDVQVHSVLYCPDKFSIIKSDPTFNEIYTLKREVDFEKIILFPKIKHELMFSIEKDSDVKNIMEFYNLRIIINYRRHRFWPLKSYETLQEFENSDNRYIEISSFIGYKNMKE